ncbi:hypothetical protein MMC14_002001 [Varicellaria rhodocarpa]|nr:hypothetical protein [Varicellaria rhodocarpa]
MSSSKAIPSGLLLGDPPSTNADTEVRGNQRAVTVPAPFPFPFPASHTPDTNACVKSPEFFGVTPTPNGKTDVDDPEYSDAGADSGTIDLLRRWRWLAAWVRKNGNIASFSLNMRLHPAFNALASSAGYQ